MYSWAVGGDPVANAVGIMGVLGGAGYFASRLVLGLEGMTKRAYETITNHQRTKRNQALDELQRQLESDQDHRTETCLSQLRDLYETFQKSCHEGHVVSTHHQLLSQAEQIFNASVQQLERSLELYQISQKLTGQPRADILAERERVIEEVIETRAHLCATIEQFQAFATRRGQSELSELRQELDETLRVAQRTEERMAEIGQRTRTYDESEFE
jgi:hypothetical protein